MSELQEILAKRRRKSEVHGAIVENAPKATIADHVHSGNTLDKTGVDDNKDNEHHNDVNEGVNDGAGNELKKILQRRRRKSETASSVIIKHGKLSDADAKHSHHEYEATSSTEVNINMVESRLRFLETKAEKGHKEMLKIERTISKNERLLSEMSLTSDGEDNDTTTSSTVDNENITSSPAETSPSKVVKEDTQPESNTEEVSEAVTTKTIMNNKSDDKN